MRNATPDETLQPARVVRALLCGSQKIVETTRFGGVIKSEVFMKLMMFLSVSSGLDLAG